MSNKPQNFAELVRYLANNPYLELHMPADNLIVRGNAGSVDMSQPARIMHRMFVKKSGMSLVFQYTSGEKTGQLSYLQYRSVKEFTFFDDRFEVKPRPDAWPLLYFYEDAPPNTETQVATC